MFSLLLIDVDRTRRINDEHGERRRRHRAGGGRPPDPVALRGEDVAGRWAGEEFVVLLPHTELDGAWRLAERIRASVCDEPVDLGDGRDVMVTVSIGCAEGFGDDPDDHLRARPGGGRRGQGGRPQQGRRRHLPGAELR